MKITVVGGSHGTGAHLSTLAQQAGHDVCIVSRSVATPNESADAKSAGAFRLVTGDATDPAVAAEGVAGADVVVITVGGAKRVTRQRAAVTRAVVTAMQEAGVRRLIVQSSLGAGDSAALMPAPIRFITKLVLGSALADHTDQETAAIASGLDWSIVRPAGLTNKAPSGNWQTFVATRGDKTYESIARADLAACILNIVDEESTIGQALSLSR